MDFEYADHELPLATAAGYGGDADLGRILPGKGLSGMRP